MSDEEKMLLTPALSEEQVRQQTKMSDDFYTVFSNSCRITVSATDFRFFIGENYPRPTGGLEIVEHFSIVVSPAQARAILNILAGSVALYEKAFGPIRTDFQPSAQLPPPSPEQPSS
jgi:hypothetical protein